MEERLIKRGETSGRVDDNAETIRKRFNTFVEETMSVIESYEEKNKVKRVRNCKGLVCVRAQLSGLSSLVRPVGSEGEPNDFVICSLNLVVPSMRNYSNFVRVP